MHELSIVEALIEQVAHEIHQAGAGGRVTRLELTIGRLSGVSPDAIRFAFELLSRETALEGSEVCIREPGAVCSCRDCGAHVEIEDLVAACPRCQSGEIVLEGGRDLVLETIELEG